MKQFVRISRRDLTPAQRKAFDAKLAEACRLHGVGKATYLPYETYRSIADSFFDDAYRERAEAEKVVRPLMKPYQGKTFHWSPGGFKHQYPPGFNNK